MLIRCGIVSYFLAINLLHSGAWHPVVWWIIWSLWENKELLQLHVILKGILIYVPVHCINWAILIHHKLRTKRIVKEIIMEANFLKHEYLEIILVNCPYLLHSYCIWIYCLINFLVISRTDHCWKYLILIGVENLWFPMGASKRITNFAPNTVLKPSF
jgi:hypothetical protein